VLKFDNTTYGNFTGSGGQGRWADGTGISLNGATVLLAGATNLDTTETVGTITPNQGGTISLAQSGTGTATLIVASIPTHVAGQDLLITTTGTGTTNALNAPTAYDRLIVTTPGTVVVNTNGMAPAWIVNQTDNTYVNYTGATNGFTDLGTGAGQVAYSAVVTSGNLTSAAGSTVDVSGSANVSGNTAVYAIRLDTGVNLTASASSNLLEVGSGGVLSNTTGTISPILLFGTGVGSYVEGLIYSNAANLIIAGGMQTTQGATFFGSSNFNITGASGGQGVTGGNANAGVSLTGTLTMNGSGVLYVNNQFALGGQVQVNNSQVLSTVNITLNRDALLAACRLAVLLNETLGTEKTSPPPPAYPAGPPGAMNESGF